MPDSDSGRALSAGITRAGTTWYWYKDDDGAPGVIRSVMYRPVEPHYGQSAEYTRCRRALAKPGRASPVNSTNEEPIDVFVDSRARANIYRFVKQREAWQQGVTHLED